jgi:hypothetical protein
MKSAIRLITICILTFIFSCQKGDLFQSRCANCFTAEPTQADVEVLLTPYSYSNYKTTISIYEGYLQDSILIQRFETSSSTWSHTMGINKTYTFVARYYKDGKFYEAINSIRPAVKYEQFLCVNKCYRVIGNQCDLRIKYH